MKDWVKIQTFQRIHQAELRKSILEDNNIPSVIINEKDSLFLLGDIELYVRSFDEAKAKKLIGEFNGLSKVNSFVGEKQMKIYCNILESQGLKPILKRKEDSKYILDNYEIYVKNEDLEQVVPYLQEENLEGWSKIRVCDSVSQTKYRIDLLDEQNIDNFIIKRKNSSFHIENIEIYVKDTDKNKSLKLLNELNGWITIRTYDELQFAEKDEDVLNEHNIKAIINMNDEKQFEIMVEANNEEKAIDVINITKQWTILKIFLNMELAYNAKNILNANGINAVIVNERDSSFLIGDIELHVEVDKKSKAESLLKGI